MGRPVPVAHCPVVSLSSVYGSDTIFLPPPVCMRWRLRSGREGWFLRNVSFVCLFLQPTWGRGWHHVRKCDWTMWARTV